MAYPPHLRERARELRVTKKLSLDEIAELLALPKTTVYYWIKDLPLGRERRENPHPGSRAKRYKWRLRREAAYARGLPSTNGSSSCQPSGTSWGEMLGVEPAAIRLQLKSNSGQLRTRIWRCKYGVAAVDVHDTYLRARIQAWMDLIHESWR